MRCLLLLIFLVLFPSITLSESEFVPKKPIKIFIVYSYSLDKFLDEKVHINSMEYVKSFTNPEKIASYFLNYTPNTPKHILEKNAETIYKLMEKDKPDFIFTYGPVAFEYFHIPYIYNLRKQNSFFFCIQESFFLESLDKFNLKQYGNLVRGNVQETNFKELIELFASRDTNFNKVILLKNKTFSDSVLENHIKTQYNVTLEVKSLDYLSELQAVLYSIDKEKDVLILYGINALYNEKTNKVVSEKEVVSTLNKYNSNLFVALNKDLSKHGLEFSYFSSYNKYIFEKKYFQLFKEFYLTNNTSVYIMGISSKFSINITKLNKLNKSSLYEDIDGIEMIWK